ncbi:hypothetical protein D6B99_03200 [Arachidicoccus soli]|uniref:Uncharacterized protein n=1 Tax=Arachidicoccus soli TaxID=2341117 RepID=A0A386HLD4_9BACT|nr:hypothetical protein D6B99_03200 [Arachidicoccus soli]
MADYNGLNLGGINGNHNSINTGTNGQFSMFIIPNSAISTGGQSLTQSQIDDAGLSLVQANPGVFQ